MRAAAEHACSPPVAGFTGLLLLGAAFLGRDAEMALRPRGRPVDWSMAMRIV